MNLTVDARLYNILRDRFGQQEADAILEIANTRVDAKIENFRELLATKEDLVREISNLRGDMYKVVFASTLASYLAITATILAIMHFVK